MPFDGHNGQFGDVARLLDARSLIADQGHWIKGRFRDGDRYCVVGAVAKVCRGLDLPCPNTAERRLLKALARQLPWRIGVMNAVRCLFTRQNLISYNDRPRTTHADVLALFDRAIAQMSSPEHAVGKHELVPG